MSSRIGAFSTAIVLGALAGACGESGAGDGAGDDTSTSTGEAPAACDAYPDGPYGSTVDTYMPADVVLEGLLEGEATRSQVRLGDLRDCDGRTGVGALYFIAARTTCSVCNREAPELDEDLDELRERGVRVVIMMLDGDVEAWRDAHGLEGALVLADLDKIFYVEGNNVLSDVPNGTPLNVVVDPRTGRIVERDLGGGFDREAMFELAERNLDE